MTLTQRIAVGPGHRVEPEACRPERHLPDCPHSQPVERRQRPRWLERLEPKDMTDRVAL